MARAARREMLNCFARSGSVGRRARLEVNQSSQFQRAYSGEFNAWLYLLLGS